MCGWEQRYIYTKCYVMGWRLALSRVSLYMRVRIAHFIHSLLSLHPTMPHGIQTLAISNIKAFLWQQQEKPSSKNARLDYKPFLITLFAKKRRAIHKVKRKYLFLKHCKETVSINNSNLVQVYVQICHFFAFLLKTGVLVELLQ